MCKYCKQYGLFDKWGGEEPVDYFEDKRAHILKILVDEEGYYLDVLETYDDWQDIDEDLYEFLDEQIIDENKAEEEDELEM